MPPVYHLLTIFMHYHYSELLEHCHFLLLAAVLTSEMAAPQLILKWKRLTCVKTRAVIELLVVEGKKLIFFFTNVFS